MGYTFRFVLTTCVLPSDPRLLEQGSSFQYSQNGQRQIFVQANLKVKPVAPTRTLLKCIQGLRVLPRKMIPEKDNQMAADAKYAIISYI
jgi:hypothetical protein